MKKSDGFSGLETILIIIVLGLVGVAGWLVWDKQHNKAKTPTNAQTTTQSTTTQQQSTTTNKVATASSKWYLYSSKDNIYKMRLADGLDVQYTDAPNYSLIAMPFTPKEGTPAKVTLQEGGKDGGVGLIVNYSKSTDISPEGKETTGFKTDAGLDVKKYVFVQETDPEGLGLPKGATQNMYFVTKDGNSLQVIYSYSKDETPQTDTVETMVKSIELL